ncbi:MAG: ABC transporter substrate-binding protein, partial [Proteobacteria bacterium]|nr:ABC transporter substrate-binding protein [Pseudomonadota bacterium]
MKQFRTVLLILCAVCLCFPVANACASSVQDQLKKSIDQILEILRDPAFKGEENVEKRRASLRSVINERFSFEKMSQLSLARHWKERSDQEKQS